LSKYTGKIRVGKDPPNERGFASAAVWRGKIEKFPSSIIQGREGIRALSTRPTGVKIG
jgi:hypothetical protein